VVFLPDRNLGRYVSKHTGKKMVIWNGYCPTHENLKAADVIEIKRAYPEAKFAAHPECLQEVLDMADVVASTSGIIRFVKSSPDKTFIIGTETAILHRLRKENPGKNLVPASRKMFCQNMKYNTLENVCDALENEEPEVTVPSLIMDRARQVITRMLAVK
jgi:quinolinate synthase